MMKVKAMLRCLKYQKINDGLGKGFFYYNIEVMAELD